MHWENSARHIRRKRADSHVTLFWESSKPHRSRSGQGRNISTWGSTWCVTKTVCSICAFCTAPQKLSNFARFCAICAVSWKRALMLIFVHYAHWTECGPLPDCAFCSFLLIFCATSNYGMIEKLKLCGTQTKEIQIMNFIVLSPTWQSKPVWKKARTMWNSNYEHSNYPKSTCTNSKSQATALEAEHCTESKMTVELLNLLAMQNKSNPSVPWHSRCWKRWECGSDREEPPTLGQR